jgi:hypothetical protein
MSAETAPWFNGFGGMDGTAAPAVRTAPKGRKAVLEKIL